MAKWATKNPPKKQGRYLVTYDGVVRQAERTEYPKGNWYWYIFPHGGYSSKVTAWMKQPKPYEGG